MSCAVIAPVSTWIGGGYIGALGGVVLAFGLIGACFGLTRFGAVQRCLERHAANRARAKRESGRESAMHRANGMRREQYSALRRLVDDIERWDADDAQRFELQELLDYFVRLSVAHQRCIESLRSVGTAVISSHVPGVAFGDPRPQRCSEIAARRSLHQTTCAQQLDHVADELDSIDELIRLIVQRVACAKFTPTTDGAIERRLAELDELDAAMSQLAATLQ